MIISSHHAISFHAKTMLMPQIEIISFWFNWCRFSKRVRSRWSRGLTIKSGLDQSEHADPWSLSAVLTVCQESILAELFSIIYNETLSNFIPKYVVKALFYRYPIISLMYCLNNYIVIIMGEFTLRRIKPTMSDMYGLWCN